MIIRIVKMTFDLDKVDKFVSFFEKHKYKIRNFPGCTYLQVLRDKSQPNIIFSYSHWESEVNLDDYRNSELFNEIWPYTKKMFSAAPEAWTTEVLHDLK